MEYQLYKLIHQQTIANNKVENNLSWTYIKKIFFINVLKIINKNTTNIDLLLLCAKVQVEVVYMLAILEVYKVNMNINK